VSRCVSIYYAVDAQSINDDDDDDDDDSIEHWLLVPEEKGRGGRRRVKKSALPRCPPPRRRRGRERWRAGADGGRAVGVSWHDVPTLFQDHRATKKTTTDCARRDWNIIYIYTTVLYAVIHIYNIIIIILYSSY